MADTSKERTKPEERLEEDLAHLNELHLKVSFTPDFGIIVAPNISISSEIYAQHWNA